MRDQMVKDLQNRVSKVLELEMELDEVKDAYRQLEQILQQSSVRASRDAIEYCARKVAAVSGDARRAMDMMARAGAGADAQVVPDFAFPLQRKR